MEWEAGDLEALARARALLEHPSFAARLTSLVGAPLEEGFRRLPASWRGKVDEAATASLRRALALAAGTVREDPYKPASTGLHKALAAASGGVGGFFGLAALAVELPFSTTLMLRSILDVARSEGERPGELATRLACLEVFALGGPSASDDAAETGYWAVRLGLGAAVRDASRYLAQRGVIDEAAPALLKLVAKLASRFGVAVSQKAAAQAVPVLGAAGGAVINVLFIDHFQDVGRGHFIVRRLERAYGEEEVRRRYEALGEA